MDVLDDDALRVILHWYGEITLQWRLACKRFASMAQLSTTPMSSVLDSVELFRWARRHGCPFDARVSALAAKSGQLACLQYAHENGCPWDGRTFANAVKHGHLACVQYAQDEGCAWDPRERTPDWTIVADTPSLLSVVRAMRVCARSSARRAAFRVTKGEGGVYTLHVGLADLGYICFVDARLHLDRRVTLFQAPDEFVFTIDFKELEIAIDDPSSPTNRVQLEGHHIFQYREVHIRTSREEEPMALMDYRGHFLDELPMEFDLLEMLKGMTRLEIDADWMRKMMQTATKAHADVLRIRIFHKIHKAPRRPSRSVVVLSARGDEYHEQRRCHETTKDDDGLRVRAHGGKRLFDTDAMAPAFDGLYPLQQLDGCVKHLRGDTVVMYVKNGVPDLLVLPHRDGDAMVHFVVAPVYE